MFFFRSNKIQKDRLVVKRNKQPIRREDPEKKRPIGRLVYYFLLLLFFAVVIYILFFSQFLNVQALALQGTNELSHEEVLEKINSSYQGKYLGFLPKNNIILISKEKIKKNLLSDFPKIKNVAIKKIFPSSLDIHVEERSSLILWCSGGPCYIIDEKGYAFTAVPLDVPEVVENNLIKLVDTSARPISVGQKIIEENYVNFLLELREKLRNTDIGIGEEWKTPSLVAEEVEIPAASGWRIYFSGKLSLEKSLRTLKTFLEEEVPAEKREKLEYVDLRVENKVYYMLKGEENTENVENTADDKQTEPAKKKNKKN
jgi:cell division septal protein FtsQ